MKGILFVSFGTTYQTAKEKQIDAVADYIQKQFPACRIAQAYTSNMVRAGLAKQGVEMPDVAGGLQLLVQQGVTQVFVQPSHLLPGLEFDKLCRAAEACRHLFKKMDIGKPLMAYTQDAHDLADILADEYPYKKDTAVVLMGHGTTQPVNTAYAAMDYHFSALGRHDLYVGTVEAYPALDTVIKCMQSRQYSKVVLAPLMLVAGDHAVNDMAGKEPDSWASRLRQAGYEVECRLTGLGELEAVQQMYVEHIRQRDEGGVDGSI